jgi:hypothetical protein
MKGGRGQSPLQRFPFDWPAFEFLGPGIAGGSDCEIRVNILEDTQMLQRAKIELAMTECLSLGIFPTCHHRGELEAGESLRLQIAQRRSVIRLFGQYLNWLVYGVYLRTKFSLAIRGAEAPAYLVDTKCPTRTKLLPIEMLKGIGGRARTAHGFWLPQLPTATAVTCNIWWGKRDKRPQRS